MRLLLIAPQYDAVIPGESWSTYKWVQGLSRVVDTTVLTQHWSDWDGAGSPIEAKQIVNWNESSLLNNRFNWELKATYPLFYWRARRWLRAALRRGERFDLIHQLNPLALRYPCPARGLGVPYLIGPLAGSLPTPAGFSAGSALGQWYRYLRRLDAFRLRYDPWLRASYREAAAVIGVAPYVGDLLRPCSPARFEVMAETGVEEIHSTPKAPLQPGKPLRLLFVGRLITTKGLLEAIESLALAARDCSVTLDVVGTGPLFAQCRHLVRRHGLENLVQFHGWLPRAEVFRWYERSDAFLFPSYREPSGNVVFEAMSRGLPVITSTVGGPGHVVTDECGFRIPPQDHAQYVSGLAAAIVALSRKPERLTQLSAGALRRITDIALWPDKINRMLALYRDILGRSAS
jgi:glycosyltransferase involved in cell wall biosynthesis